MLWHAGEGKKACTQKRASPPLLWMQRAPVPVSTIQQLLPPVPVSTMQQQSYLHATLYLQDGFGGASAVDPTARVNACVSVRGKAAAPEGKENAPGNMPPEQNTGGDMDKVRLCPCLHAGMRVWMQ